MALSAARRSVGGAQDRRTSTPSWPATCCSSGLRPRGGETHAARARCGALAEGLLARVGAMADATDGAPGGERELGRLRGVARELRADGARFEAAWSELRKAYLRGRREVDRHAATIEMESGMSLDDRPAY